MYDYVDGKADWMAYGLPVEGRDGPFVGQQVVPVPTCDITLTVGDARRALAEAGGDLVVVVAGERLAVGELDAETMEGHSDGDALIDVMSPVPSTLRPSVTVASVAAAGGGRRLVTTSDGRLSGAVVVRGNEGEQGDEHEHDHDQEHVGHDDEDVDIDLERYERELAKVMEAVEERFGDREPTEEELRVLLRDRLVAEGRSPEEADRFLDEMSE